MDLIRIKDLRVQAHVGVTEEEQATPQPLSISLDVGFDAAPSGASDDLTETIDYGELTVGVAALVRTGRPKLLERLAEEIAAHVGRQQRVLNVSVEVSKLDPPIPEELESAGVKIERSFPR